MNLVKVSMAGMLLLLETAWAAQSDADPPPTASKLQVAPSAETPAHLAARKFMRGVNLGNYLEYAAGSPTANATYNLQDFALIRAEGFDHVRIPVAWHLYAGPAPNYTLSSGIFPKVDFMVNAALSANLAVIINLHHFDAFNDSPPNNAQKFYAIWRQVAARYAEFAPTVGFELLNEPRDAATTLVINPIYAETIRQIRQTNPNRTIFVGPGEFNNVDQLNALSLPASDKNLIATVHSYDPYYFTHQGAEWAFPDTATTSVIYPGPPTTAIKPHASITHSWVLEWFRSYNTLRTEVNPSSSFAFRNKLQRAKSWASQRGRPVHVGEFGCYEKAAAGSRVNYYEEVRKTMDGLGLGWAMWDWKSGFHYIKNSRPDPLGMREAMFPPIELRIQSTGGFEFEGAIGKTYIVEKAASLVPPASWQPVSTQTLASPNFVFSDAEIKANGEGFYRVQWVK